MANIFTKENGSFTRQLPFYPTPTGQPLANNQSNFTNNFGRELPPTPVYPTPTGQAPARTLATPPPQAPPQAPLPPTYTPPTPATPTPTGTNNPYDAFNLLLQESLKTAQKIDTTDLLKQQRELQRARIERETGGGIRPPTPEELKFLSPSQQETMRGADVNALSSGIDEVAYQITKLNNERKDLIDQIQFAREGGDKARASALDAEYRQKDEEYRQATLAETKRSNRAGEATANAKLAADIAATGAGIDATSTAEKFAFLSETANKALGLSHASGRSGIRRTGEATFIGATDFTDLVALANTLKTNMLTVATDPAIKKFFGPQMSNADVELMVSAGTTMNPEKQSPEIIKAEILRLQEIFKRLGDAASAASGGTTGQSSGDPEYDAYLKTINQ